MDIAALAALKTEMRAQKAVVTAEGEKHAQIKKRYETELLRVGKELGLKVGEYRLFTASVGEVPMVAKITRTAEDAYTCRWQKVG